MPRIRDLALVVRFLVELFAIAAVGWWGAQLDASPIVRVLAGVAAPVALIVVWGLFVSPRPRVVEPPPVRFGIEFVVWLAAFLALVGVSAVGVAIGFALLMVADLALLWSTRDIRSPLDPGSRPDPGTPRVG